MLNPLVYHTADYKAPFWQVDGTEINRVLSYWRAGAYHPDTAGADGFASGSGATVVTRHGADYKAPFGQIDGTEINRVLSYWRAGEYHADATGADGFASGPRVAATAKKVQATGRVPQAVGTATITQSGPANYTAGASMQVTARFAYSGPLGSLLVRPALPAGWTLAGATATGNGTAANVQILGGEIVFADFTLPASPIDIVMTVQVPTGQTGDQTLRSEVEYQFTGDVNPTSAFATPDPLTIQPPQGAPGITSSLTAGGSVGQTFAYTITANNTPTTFGATGLPAGLTVNTANGQISGTPSASGTFNVDITATNAGGTGTQRLVITVVPARPGITSSLTAAGTVGQVFAYTITANNTPTTFGATGLPAGLTVNTANGQISGTPSASGTFNVDITATNAGGTGTQRLVITIVPARPGITSSLTAVGTVGQVFAYTITANSAPTTFGATGLPAGLTVNPASGQISGTPSASGTFNVDISASNAGGTATQRLVMTINTAPQPPTINTPPASVAVCPGSSVTLSVTASGSGTLSYQWSKGTTPLPGETGRTLTIANVDATTIGSYSVVVANNVGPTPSSAAVVSLNVPASITTPPQPVTVTRGGQAVFMVAVTGTPTPTLQWFKGTIALSGQTGTTLTLNNVQSANAGDYKVQVVNACATVESTPVALTVNGPVEITSQPQSQTQRVGATATFRVVAAGTPPLTYQWRRNGTDILGQTTDTMTVPTVSLADDQAGFDVIVSNVVGAVPSTVARLTVVQPPVITRAPGDQTVLPGTTATFAIEATGTGTLTYLWKRDGVVIPGATGPSYTVANAQLAANAVGYTVVVSNAEGSEERTAFLKVVLRQLKVGDVQVASAAVGSPVTVPIIFVGNGTETKVSLSVAFDPAVVTFTTVNGAPAGATLTVNNPGGNSPIGVTVQMPDGQTFAAGSNLVAQLVFATATAAQVSSALVQGDTPVARQVLDGAAATLPTEFANGSVTIKTPVSPAVADATGLLGEIVAVSTPPSGGGGGFVRVLVYDLGADRLGNAIRLQNAAGTTAAGIPYVFVPAPAPGTAVNLVLEYYVSDRTTVPTPRLVVETTPTGLPAVAGTAMALEAQGQRGFVNGDNGGFYLNFRTQSGGTYYVQYRDNATDPWLTSFPAVPGNGGYVQWIDGGPPRTSSPPTGGTRFYRVIRVQ